MCLGSVAILRGKLDVTAPGSYCRGEKQRHCIQIAPDLLSAAPKRPLSTANVLLAVNLLLIKFILVAKNSLSLSLSLACSSCGIIASLISGLWHDFIIPVPTDQYLLSSDIALYIVTGVYLCVLYVKTSIRRFLIFYCAIIT